MPPLYPQLFSRRWADGFAESVLDIPNPDISERVYGSAFAAKVSPLFCCGTYPVLAALPDATAYQRVGEPHAELRAYGAILRTRAVTRLLTRILSSRRPWQWHASHRHSLWGKPHGASLSCGTGTSHGEVLTARSAT